MDEVLPGEKNTGLSLGAEELRLYQRLAKIAPAAATMFMDATRLMSIGTQIESRAHLVAHLVREIESTLTAMLDPQGGKNDAGEPDGEGAKRKRIIEALELGTDEAWVELASKRNREELRPAGWAHRDSSSLDRLRGTDNDFDRFWRLHSAMFDALLDVFERRSVFIQQHISEIVRRGPTAKSAEALAARMPRDLVTMRELFAQCADPAWLGPLHNVGLLTCPPEPVTTAEGKRYSSWPAGDYLTQMASVQAAQDEVTGILETLSPTENIYAYQNVVDAAKQMSASRAARLVAQVERGIALASRLPSQRDVAELVSNLASGGALDEAYLLATPLLRLDAREGPLTRDLVSQYGDWGFGEACSGISGALIDADPERALSLAADLLEAAVALVNGERDAQWDMSEYWRPDIRDSDDNRDSEPRNALVSFVRDAALKCAVSGRMTIAECVERLTERKPMVFTRVAIDLLAQHPANDVDLTTSYFLSGIRDDEERTSLEMVRLQSVAYPIVPEAARDEFLRTVFEGPELEEWRARFFEWKGSTPSAEDEDGYIRAWRARRLFPVKDCLPAEHLSEYERMAETLETQPAWDDYAQFKVRSGWGDRPPVDRETLAGMTVEELTAYLRDWAPEKEDDFLGPTIRGLASQVQSIIESDPGSFAPVAPEFLDLKQDYVNAVIRGFEQALRNKTEFQWDGVIDLLRGCTLEHRYEYTGSGRTEGDETLAASASLLADGMLSQVAPIPALLLPSVWEILLPVFEDPNPTEAHEAEFGGTNMDPFTLSLNTVRGKAAHALMAYMVEAAKQDGVFDLDLEDRRGISSRPEVAEKLEQLLDITNEKSLAVRAAIGARLDWIAIVDPEWLRAHWESLFPALDMARRHVVFDAYLTFGTIRTPILPDLRSEYHFRAAHIAEELPVVWERNEPTLALARHIVVLYQIGAIELDDELMDLLYADSAQPFWETASVHPPRLASARRDAKEQVEPAFLDRACALWERRIGLAEQANAVGSLEAHRDEIVAFGAMVDSSLFPSDWWLTQLERVLALVHWVEPDYVVIQSLAEDVVTHPGRIVDAATDLLVHDPEGYVHQSSRREYLTIVEAGVSSTDPAVRAKSRELANRLAAKGMSGFQQFALSENWGRV
ncbi:MAG: hypothetical protein Q7W51_02735 [Coriobacteriia bacterium]|nr:hypothetical protein [Coriobacteriia bacterium]